jgi:16S rRNA (guanine527-N7)-methyltransferase
MARQQALSFWFIVLPVIQASKGAAVESRMKIAKKLARRRILLSVYVRRVWQAVLVCRRPEAGIERRFSLALAPTFLSVILEGDLLLQPLPTMPTLPETRIHDLIQPYLAASTTIESTHINDSKELISKLSLYLDLLLKWNARTNLTAIRDPEEIVTRHFGESLFAARLLSPYLSNGSGLLDFGSGAGFPGLPIQLFRPDLHVTLAESQNKKASFLREAVRTLGLQTEVWAARVETMPAKCTFHCVALRAVDNMDQAITAAQPRIADGGYMALLTRADAPNPPTLQPSGTFPIPGTDRTVVALYQASA